ncbi:hypothetical protein DPEC_G00346330 [Dallia pectoralis]|uniref:Uncharacterized protein n=1 Tax=Dallia pectoralis TaxID=75939 RepID=A0ACC2F3X1_DALPE|nr:hypothetical protein DPEC_G00346330 [Dallia pectoralis]
MRSECDPHTIVSSEALIDASHGQRSPAEVTRKDQRDEIRRRYYLLGNSQWLKTPPARDNALELDTEKKKDLVNAIIRSRRALREIKTGQTRGPTQTTHPTRVPVRVRDRVDTTAQQRAVHTQIRNLSPPTSHCPCVCNSTQSK